MSVKIALLGFGTVASGVPFLLKGNHEKITQAAQDEIEIAKVLVRDDEEKEKLQAAGRVTRSRLLRLPQKLSQRQFRPV